MSAVRSGSRRSHSALLLSGSSVAACVSIAAWFVFVLLVLPRVPEGARWSAMLVGGLVLLGALTHRPVRPNRGPSLFRFDAAKRWDRTSSARGVRLLLTIAGALCLASLAATLVWASLEGGFDAIRDLARIAARVVVLIAASAILVTFVPAIWCVVRVFRAKLAGRAYSPSSLGVVVTCMVGLYLMGASSIGFALDVAWDRVGHSWMHPLVLIAMAMSFAGVAAGEAAIVWLFGRCFATVKPWTCAGCGYDRRGLAESAVCPECGRSNAAPGGRTP